MQLGLVYPPHYGTVFTNSPACTFSSKLPPYTNNRLSDQTSSTRLRTTMTLHFKPVLYCQIPRFSLLLTRREEVLRMKSKTHACTQFHTWRLSDLKVANIIPKGWFTHYHLSFRQCQSTNQTCILTSIFKLNFDLHGGSFECPPNLTKSAALQDFQKCKLNVKLTYNLCSDAVRLPYLADKS